MKNLTPQQKAEIIRRSKQGETQNALAEAYNCSQSTINRTLKSAKTDAEIKDPFPALTTETLQKRYWSKFKRLARVVENRDKFLDGEKRGLVSAEIRRWEQSAKTAPTPQLANAHKHRADSFRFELAALSDLSEFNDEMLELLTELKTLADTLVKVRKVGMGNERIED